MHTPMFRPVVLVICVLVLAALLVPAQPLLAAEEKAASGPVERTLPSGASALLWPRPGSGTVLVAVAVPAGSQDEPAGMGGLSHYLEHLLFDGFDELDERGVTEAFERLSAYMNAFTREQTTVYFALIPRADAVAAAELMVGMLTRSTIEAEVYEKEKKVILEELAKDHASPDGLKEDRLREALWQGTPLEHPVGGSESSVGATPRDKVVAYWNERYVPSGFRLLITGDLDVGGLEAVLKPFAALGPSDRAAARPDQLEWSGWGEWVAMTAPEAPAGGGMPTMGMGGGGHGMSGRGQAPSGGTLAVVIAVPDALSESGTEVEILARWLSDSNGPFAAIVGPGLAREISVTRQPREPRDLLEIRVEAEMGADPESLLALLLGTLNRASAGPTDTEAAIIQRTWAGERALSDQRPHYAAVFFGEALASARGSLIDSVSPPVVEATVLRSTAAALLTNISSRSRAAWLGKGGPEVRVALPEAQATQTTARSAMLENGPLGSRVTTLENGVVVGVLPEVGSDVFGIHLLVADRTLREPDGAPGISDFVHRLLSAGTALGDSGDFARRVERAGFEVKVADSPMIPFDNRYHVPDFSYVRIEGPATGLEIALAMLAEMIRVPAWDNEGWRGAMTSHQAARKADNRGSEKAQQLFFGALLGTGHPLAQPVSGPLDAPPVDADAVRKTWNSWPDGFFAPAGLVVTVASPVSAEETVEMVKDFFSGGPSAEPRRGPYPEPEPATDAPIVEIGEAPQVTLLWGRIAEVEPEDRVATLVAMDSLSDKMTAVIREREGLAYRLGAGVRNNPDGSWILSATVGTRPENSDRVAGLLEELVGELAAEAMDESDLDRWRARQRRSRMLRGMSAASRAYRVGRALFEGPGSPLAVDEEAYAEVTPEAIQSAAKKYLVPEKMLLVVTP